MGLKIYFHPSTNHPLVQTPSLGDLRRPATIHTLLRQRHIRLLRHARLDRTRKYGDDQFMDVPFAIAHSFAQNKLLYSTPRDVHTEFSVNQTTLYIA